MEIIDLGTIDFTAAYAIQERIAAEIAAGTGPETLLLLEHPPVYTIGSGGRSSNILREGIDAVRTNRGGDVTWHGPGQLVGYPLIDLGRRGRDLHGYLRFLEEVVLRLASGFGVAAGRVAGRTGVWTARGKLASIGVGVRRWVTMHGFALNVAGDLDGFASINPCGIPQCPVTSLERETGDGSISLPLVKARCASLFRGCLDEELIQLPDNAMNKENFHDQKAQSAR